LAIQQCSAVQCSAVQCSAVQCSAVQCSAVQCSAVRSSRAFGPALIAFCNHLAWPAPPKPLNQFPPPIIQDAAGLPYLFCGLLSNNWPVGNRPNMVTSKRSRAVMSARSLAVEPGWSRAASRGAPRRGQCTRPPPPQGAPPHHAPPPAVKGPCRGIAVERRTLVSCPTTAEWLCWLVWVCEQCLVTVSVQSCGGQVLTWHSPPPRSW
jgi:hypothetical protein